MFAQWKLWLECCCFFVGVGSGRRCEGLAMSRGKWLLRWVDGVLDWVFFYLVFSLALAFSGGSIACNNNSEKQRAGAHGGGWPVGRTTWQMGQKKSGRGPMDWLPFIHINNNNNNNSSNNIHSLQNHHHLAHGNATKTTNPTNCSIFPIFPAIFLFFSCFSQLINASKKN